MHSQATTATFPRAVVISKMFQLVAAFLLGAGLIYGTGFSHISAVHNAAHDVRHSTDFPCH